MQIISVRAVSDRGSRRRLTATLLTGTALVGVATALLAGTPALASGQGGQGGAGDQSVVAAGSGGSGGTNGNGQDGAPGSGVSTGGAGGTSPGADGLGGTPDAGGGGGGGGGASGADLSFGILNNTGTLTAGTGGAGGSGASLGAGGGGGGGGGDIVVTGTGAMSNSGSLTGGQGGDGGSSDTSGGTAGQKGYGGNGGAGLLFTMGGVTFTNTAAGTIAGGVQGDGNFGAGNHGGAGVVSNATMTIVNAGAINGGAGPASNGYGIDSVSGTLTLTNSGTITGLAGVRGAGDALTLTNSGAITGIGNGSNGVFSTGVVDITNAGLISSDMSTGNAGIQAAGGKVTNLASSSPTTGTIQGFQFGIYSNGPITVSNAGTITGVGVGALTTGDSTIVNAATGLIRGNGFAAISNASGLQTIVNSGALLSSSGVAVAGGFVSSLVLTNNAGDGVNTGIIQGTSGVNYDGAVTITNSGAIVGTSDSGIAAGGGSITNAATGLIEGSVSAIANLSGLLTITNSGAIKSGDTAIDGRFGSGSLLVTNNAGDGVTSGLISGGQYGIKTLVPTTVINSGAIIGSGPSGIGILADTTLSVVNYAGNGSTTGLISGATGISITSNGVATITNAGTIQGSHQYGIFSNGLTSVFNDGTITGNVAAIRFGAAGSTLTLGANSVISGAVVGTGGDTFQLGGTGSATFDAGSIGSTAQYQGFSTFNKVGDSIWTLTGTPGQATSWNINSGTLSVSSDGNLGSANEALSINGGILQVTGTAFTATTRNINLGVNGGGFDIADAGNTFDVSSALSGPGGLTKLGAGTLRLSGITDYSGATNVMAGTLQASSASGMLSQNSDFTIAAGATLDLNNSFQFIGSLSGAGTVTNSAAGAATLSVGGNSVSTTFSGTIADGPGGPVALWVGGFGSSGTFTLTGNNAYSGGTLICSCWALQLGNGGTTGSITGDVTNGGTLIFNRSNAYTFGGVISDDNSDPGKVVQAGSGITTLTGLNTYSGGTFVNAGTLRIGGAGTLGDSGAATTVAGGTLDLGSTTQTQNGGVTLTSGAIINGTLVSSALFELRDGTIGATLAGTGGVTKVGTGRANITGTEAYTGATTVNGGTLSVNGDITSSSSVTVNAGGTLGGNGFVGNTTINGGTLAPGNSIGLLTVAGNLVLTSAASYVVEVSPTSADRVNVTGTATLGGATVNTSFTGSYLPKQYAILNATGGISGTFSSLVNSNLPSTVSSSLSYDANNVYLDLKLNFGIPSGLNINQQNVGSALTGYFNRNGGIPLAFAALSPAGLTQVSGELATGTQQATFDAMNLFLGLLTDPTVAGRGFGAATPGVASFADQALAYAGQKRAVAERDAFAMITKAVPRAPTFEARWNVWAAGFGGSRNTGGNAALGSNDATASVGGVAVGADYLLSPNTVAGFALSGGATNFSVANAGSGRSDLFQAGAYVRHTAASAYITAALAYGWQDVTTDRSVTVAGIDRLHANFKANSYSARIEGGNRYVLPWMNGGIGITPYAVAQITALDLPAYAETINGGANTFALNYSSKTVTSPRTELGLRSDKSFAVADAVLTLRGRAAWAHDFHTDRSVAAVFQTLPGAAFVVNGAAASPDSALTTAAAEMRFACGISLAATFEGEFSGGSRSYAGKSVARYGW
ncbi:beta strand repeat-containing protein [Rhodopseudomonas sp. RCAM05734]|uniref:beta strand repeat-containing protein n=1 Tax=Rhodopseudomonas sp. RCAM05734 TaxID=3457549 RepID=UPI004043D50B